MIATHRFAGIAMNYTGIDAADAPGSTRSKGSGLTLRE